MNRTRAAVTAALVVLDSAAERCTATTPRRRCRRVRGGSARSGRPVRRRPSRSGRSRGCRRRRPRRRADRRRRRARSGTSRMPHRAAASARRAEESPPPPRPWSAARIRESGHQLRPVLEHQVGHRPVRLSSSGCRQDCRDHCRSPRPQRLSGSTSGTSRSSAHWVSAATVPRPAAVGIAVGRREMHRRQRRNHRHSGPAEIDGRTGHLEVLDGQMRRQRRPRDG